MLIRITDKDKIKDQWDIIWETVVSNIPPIMGNGNIKKEKVLDSILNDQVYLWAIHAEGNFDDAFGFILTSITYEPFSCSFAMFIISGAVMSDGGSKEWVNAATELFSHAVRKQCSRIYGYSRDQKVLAFLKELKANTEYTYVYAELMR